MFRLGGQSVRSLKRIRWGAIVGALALMAITLWVKPGAWLLSAIATIPFLRLARAARRAIDEAALG